MQLSVIIPARNAAAYLAEAIESVLPQLPPQAELIVVDDGSTDDTAQIAQAKGAKVLLRDPEGFSAAINAGVEASRGEFLALLDADDLWLPGKVQAQLSALNEGKADGCFTHIQTFQHSDREQRDTPQPGLLSSSSVVRRERFVQVGQFDTTLRFGAFVDWMDKARTLGLVFDMLPEVLTLRRAHDHNSTRDRAAMAIDFLRVARLAQLRKRTASMVEEKSE